MPYKSMVYAVACVHILPSLFKRGTKRRQRNTQARVGKCHSLGHSRIEKRQRAVQARKNDIEDAFSP